MLPPKFFTAYLKKFAPPGADPGDYAQDAYEAYWRFHDDFDPDSDLDDLAPPDKMGLKCQNVTKLDTNGRFGTRVHWINLIIPFHSQQERINAMDFVLGSYLDEVVLEEDRPCRYGKSWGHSLLSIKKIKILWNDSEDKKFGDLLISIPGSVLDSATAKENWDVFYTLFNGWGAYCTKIHIALDDYEKAFSYDQLLDAGIKENMRSPLQVKPIPGIYRPGEGWGGWTVDFGSPSSDFVCTFYDKNAESKGKINSHRMEVKYSGLKAAQIFKEYVDDIEFDSPDWEFKAYSYLSSIVGGSVDFLDRQSDPHQRASRCERLSWWSDFIQAVETQPYRPKILVQPVTLDSKLNWINRSWVTTLSTLKECIGSQGYHHFLESLLQQGYDRMTDRHWKFIKVVT